MRKARNFSHQKFIFSNTRLTTSDTFKHLNRPRKKEYLDMCECILSVVFSLSPYHESVSDLSVCLFLRVICFMSICLYPESMHRSLPCSLVPRLDRVERELQLLCLFFLFQKHGDRETRERRHTCPSLFSFSSLDFFFSFEEDWSSVSSSSSSFLFLSFFFFFFITEIRRPAPLLSPS